MSEARGGGRRDKQVSMSSRACWTVFLAFFALGVVSSVSLNKAAPVLTVIGADFGMDLGALGWINSCFSVMGMAVAFPAALLIRKLGFKGCVAVSGAAIVVGGLLGLFAATTPVFLASRVIEGLALGLNAVVCPAAVVRLFEPRRRGLPMGVWATWIGFGGIIAYVLAPAMSSAFGWRSLWALSAVLGAAALAFALAVLRFPQQQEDEEAVAAASSEVRADMRSIVFVSAAFLVWNFVLVGAISSFYPTYLQDAASFDPATAALVSAAPNVLSMFAAPIAGPLVAKRILYKPVTVVFYVIALVVFGLVSFMAQPSLLSIGVSVVVVGITAGVVPTMIFSLIPIYARTPQKADFGMALLAVFQNGGMMLGPAIFGATVAATSWADAGLVLLIPIMLVGLVFLLLMANPKKVLGV